MGRLVCMVLSRQKQVFLKLSAMRAFARRLRAAMRLGKRDFNVCFVGDREIERLNATFRGKPRPTDVLAFPWQKVEKGSAFPRVLRGRRYGHGADEWTGYRLAQAEFGNFLGDVVISAETARRNARAEQHSTQNEVRWLMLHGLLHLLGCDHETDNGEMSALEHSLRARLGIDGRKAARRKRKVKG